MKLLESVITLSADVLLKHWQELQRTNRVRTNATVLIVLILLGLLVAGVAMLILSGRENSGQRVVTRLDTLIIGISF